jgi:transcription initiation factor TFIIIB Brf1 subunit/transcription initiation factor TFIIB
MTEEHPICIADQIKIYIGAFCDSLRLLEETKPYAMKLYEQVRGELFLNGKNPRAVAVGLIYTAACMTNDPVTQKDIAEVTGVAPVTISTMWRKLQRYFGYEYFYKTIGCVQCEHYSWYAIHNKETGAYLCVKCGTALFKRRPSFRN